MNIDEVARELDAFLKPESDGSQARRRERILQAATNHIWSREMLEGRSEMLVDLMMAVANGAGLMRKGMPLEAYAETLADVIVDGVLAPTSNPGRGRD